MHNQIRLLLLTFLITTLGGCVGARTFHEYARAGDTVAVAAGWKQHFRQDNITVTITPSSGTSFVLPPNDPSIAAVVNLYPDPVSGLALSSATQTNITPGALTYANLVNSFFTQGDNDWWETSVFIHLPTALPTGTATITITNTQGESSSSQLDIIDGIGSQNTFSETVAGSLNNYQLYSLQRAPHYTVSFTASTIPYAIQVDMTHSPDKNNGGSGLAYAVNPRGELKSLNWSDTGSSMRVLLTPARTQALNNIKDFKFYVAGGITGLAISGIKAVDANGNTVAGVAASIN